MSYYRPSPTRFVWGVAIAAACIAGLWLAGLATIDAIREDERAEVLREGDTLNALWRQRATALQRERDSLGAVVGRVDTVLVERIRRIRDTAWLPADTSPVVRLAACRAQLDTLALDCLTFRQVATTALAQADTIIRRDSAAIAGLSLQLAALRRADSITTTAPSRRSRTLAFVSGACLTSLAGNVLQWRAR